MAKGAPAARVRHLFTPASPEPDSELPKELVEAMDEVAAAWADVTTPDPA